MNQNAAVVKLEKAISDALESENDSLAIEAYIKLGRYYQNEKDTPKGLTQFDQAIKLSQKSGDIEAESRLLGLIGSALKQIGNFQDSTKSYNKSLRLAEEIDNKVLMLDAYLHLGIVLVERGKNLEAISKLDNALALAMLLNDQKRMQNVSNMMGNIFLTIQSTEKALENFSTAQQTARILKDIEGEATALINLGRTFIQDEIYDSAIEHFELALDLTDNINNPLIEIQVLKGLMHANVKAGKNRLSLIYGEQLVNKAGLVDNILLEIQTIYEFGQNQLICKKLDAAIKGFRHGLEISRLHKEPDWEFRFLKLIGVACYQTENFPEAEKNLQEALNHASHLQMYSEEMVILGQLSAIKADSGDLAGSITNSEKALELAREHENKLFEGQQLVLLGMNYHELGEKDNAVIKIEEAITIFTELGENDLKAHAENFKIEFKGN